MTDINNLELRQLQVEACRALSTIITTNNNIHQFNSLAHHNSHMWYKAVIQWYIDQYGDLPSVIGPGRNIKLILDNV